MNGRIRFALFFLVLTAPCLAQEEPPPEFLLAWGSSGGREGEFNQPSDLAVDAEGRVYVADTSNRRIQVFDGEGRFLAAWPLETAPLDVHAEEGFVYVTVTGSPAVQKRDQDGTLLETVEVRDAAERARFIRGAARTPDGNAYVIEHDEIKLLSPGGDILSAWGAPGRGPGEFRNPQGLTLDAEGNLYVADTFNNRVQKFSPDGILLTVWGELSTKPPEPGRFRSPSAVAVDGEGNVYVADFGNNRVEKFGERR